MMRRTMSVAASIVVVALTLIAPCAVAAEPLTLKLLPRYSFATFKSDAPLETVVGHTADAGIQGTLTVDPEKPQDAKGAVKVDMNHVKTGIERRDADMRTKPYLETEIEANRWVTFEIKKVEVAGRLEPGKPMPARVHGVLTVKQKPVDRVADATVTYVKLTPEQAEAQKRFGFTSDNIKVRARFATTFTDHGMQVPQLYFLKVNNELILETDLTFVRQ